MDTPQIYVIDLPQDAQELLADNRVDLVAAMRDDGLEVSRGSLPAGTPATEGGKEVLLTLLAIGLTGSMVASGIAKVLDSLARNKKYLVTEHILLPVLDVFGNIVKNPAGQPITYWSEKTRLVEATQVAQDKSKISGEVGPTKLKFSISSGG
jgi:hypothetical protein